MLNSISIKNFRIFDKFSLNRLARVNLIVGKNNIGKSSLLEALYLLVSQETPRALIKLLEARGEISFTQNDSFHAGEYEYEVSHLFFRHILRHGVTIQINSENGDPYGLKITFLNNFEQLSLSEEEEPSRRRSPSFLRVEYSDRKFELDVFGDVLDRHRLRMLSDVASTKSNSNYITTKGFDYGVLANLWNKITLTPKEDDVINMLQILEPDIDRISFKSRTTSNSGILIKHKGQDYPLPLGSMGDGMHRILAIAAALANSENGYLFIDEIDTGLHYRTITDMWSLIFKTAERLNIQVFATTHSSDCIESFDEALKLQDNPTIGKLFRLEHRGEDVIVPVEYETEDLTTAVRQDIEVR